MSVDIDVNLDVDIADDIASIKAQLETLDEDIDLDVEKLDLDIPDDKTVHVNIETHGQDKIAASDQKVHFLVDKSNVKSAIHNLRDKTIEKKVDLKANESVFTGSLGPIAKKLNSFEDEHSFNLDINSLYFQAQLNKLGGQIRAWKKGLDDIELNIRSDIDGQSLQELLGLEDAKKSNEVMIATLRGIREEIGKKQPRRITNSSDFGSVRKRDVGNQGKDDHPGAFAGLFSDDHKLNLTDLVDEDRFREGGLNVPSINTQKLFQRMRAGPSTLDDGITGSGGIIEMFRDKQRAGAKGRPNAADAILNRVKKVLGDARPTFGRIYAVLSALLPVIAGLGVQVLGLAAAFGALGVAAGAVGGLGLLGGESDTLAGSVANAEDKLNSFKSDLFQIFEPVADAFANDSAAMMDAFLDSIGRVTDEARGLQQFTSIVVGLFPYLATALEDSLSVINSYSEGIGRLANSTGQLLATEVPAFLDALLNEGLSSTDQFGDIVDLLFSVGFAAVVLVDNLMNFLEVLAPLKSAITAVAKVFNNSLVQQLLIVAFTIISVIAVISVFSTVIGAIVSALGTLAVAFATSGGMAAFLGSTIIGSVVSSIGVAITQIYSLITVLMGMNTVLGITAALVTAITGGLALIGAAGAILTIGGSAADAIGSAGNPQMGGSGSSLGGGSGGGDTYVNVEGDMDNQSLQSIRDITEEQSDKRSNQNGQGF